MRATASSVGLLEHCSWWATERAVWTKHTSEAMGFGTEEHAYAESVIEAGADATTPQRALVRKWIIENRNGTTRAEIPIAMDLESDTAWTLDKRLGHREYALMGAHSSALCGTADAITLRDGVVEVWDWVHGREWDYKIPQQRTLSLMAARAYAAQKARYKIVRVLPDDVSVVAEDELDEFQLAAISGDLSGRVAEIGKSDPVPGSWCGHCPARTHCPATQEALAQVVPADALVRHKMTDALATQEQAAWFLSRLNLLESFVKAGKDAAKDFARQHGGIYTSEGKVWRECTRNMPRFDKQRALGMLLQKGATQAEVDGLTYRQEEQYFAERKI